MARFWLAWTVAAWLAAGPSIAAAERPAVARPTAHLRERAETKGTVFFVASSSRVGVAAIGTAHTFERDDLLEALRISFKLGGSRQPVATSGGLLAEPGRPFNEDGATLRDDFVIYALEAKPAQVRVLQLETRGAPPPGGRVRILGIPQDGGSDEIEVAGTVSESTPARLEIELDQPHNLRGWGGAPVLAERTGRVVGILQAYWPQESPPRVSVAPLGGVLEALQSPLEGGEGRPFYRFVEGGENGDGRLAAAGRGFDGLIPAYPDGKTQVQLQIQHPPQGAVVGGSACGVFVAGRAMAHEGALQKFDVVLVIDTSRSTADPADADINGNGVIGRRRLGGVGSIFAAGSTDPGDSILAAEVAAARQLLRGLDPRSTRVALVTFAGDPDQGRGPFARGPGAPAVTIEPLTNQFSRIERALDRVLARDPAGNTHMAAGVDQATIELMGLRGALSQPDPKAEKIVLFFTDGQPTLPYGPGFEADNVRAVLRAANRADRAEIRIHSFAIGPDALDGPISTVEMAARTRGFFTPVRHPGDLVDVVEQVSFANVSDVRVVNTRNSLEAEPFRATADGSWGGFVRAEAGLNRIQVQVSATDGSTVEEEIEFRFDPETKAGAVPPEMVVARNRLLEDCLRILKEARLQAERDRAEQVRRDLKVEIEKERAKARERAEQQRKVLQIDADEE